jgi:hypothetical protein
MGNFYPQQVRRRPVEHECYWKTEEVITNTTFCPTVITYTQEIAWR